MKFEYDDILNLPHHVSKTRPRMSNYDRAAQFSPFAALKGYDDEIAEAERVTAFRPEFDEERVRAINETLLLIKERASERPNVALTYFRADEKKEGGGYISHTGAIKKVDEYAARLIFTDGEAVPFHDIVEIELL